MSVVVAKDWIYIVGTAITVLMGVFNVYLFIRRNRDDKKKERETLKKEKLERHAELFETYYWETRKSFRKFRKRVKKLKEKNLSEVTQYDVLIYMFRNQEIFDKLDLEYSCHHRAERNFWSCTRDKVEETVEIMMKLFTSFRFKLPDMENEECPESYKNQFGTEIIKFGKLIYPFVWKKEQETISKVMKYFGEAVQGREACDGHPFALFQNLEKRIEEGKIDESALAEKTKQILQYSWSNLDGNALHLVRIVIFHIMVDLRRFEEDVLCEYVDYIKGVVAPKLDSVFIGVPGVATTSV